MADADGSRGQLVAGRYRLQRLIGRGGMGAVWAAHDEVLGRDVAVKEVLPSLDLTPAQREEIRLRTMREARAAARVSHPSAVTVFDVVEEQGRPWIVMQLLAPRTLADAVAESVRLPPGTTARIGAEIIQGLRAAHLAGVLHRDVKPANVMLTETGRAVLTDFGIATVEGDPTLTQNGMLVGSPGFMAPERARGERPTTASDLWSLGATLYAAVEGEAPYRREGQLATLNAVINEPPPDAIHGGALAPVIAQLLAKDPADRPDAARAEELLRRVADSVPSTATTIDRSQPATAIEDDETFAVWKPRPALPALLPLPGRPRSATAHVSPAATAPVNQAATLAESARPTEPAAAEATTVAEPATLPEPATRTERPGRPALRPRALAVGVVAVVALIAVVVAPALFRDRTQRPSPAVSTTNGTRALPGDPVPAATLTSSPNRSASPTAAGTPSEASPRPSDNALVPKGFRLHRDRTGFSVVVPSGWTRSVRGSGVFFSDPKGRGYLQVDQTTHPKADVLRDWTTQESSVARRLPGYRRIQLHRIDYKGWQAADWEFTWSASGGTLHVINRNIRVDDRQAYALYWSIPAQEWQDRLSTFRVIADSFTSAS